MIVIYFQKINGLFLPDPIINIKFRYQLGQQKQKEIENHNEYFIALEDLPNKNNFIYLIDEFDSFLKDYPNNNLLIFGEGEQKKNWKKNLFS